MVDQKTTARALAGLLEDHLDEIAESWAEKAHQNTSFSDTEGWYHALRALTMTGVQAAIGFLRTGDSKSLNSYITKLSTVCWHKGLTNGDTTEVLLLCKDAVLSVVRRYAFDLDLIWSMIAEVDACLRSMVGCFNLQYEAEANRRLRKQHEYIVSMLRMGVRDSESIDIDEVLQQVAEGIIVAVDVDHCDFFLMDEHQNRLVPRSGVRRNPPSQAVEQYFLSHPPDLTTDIFLRDLLQRKEPLVSCDAPNDPRVNRKLLDKMGTKSVLAVPLVANDRVLAVAVTGTFRDYRAFTEEQIELAWDVTRAASLVIENARLHEQTRHVAALEERERLAREIHDNLAQALSILKLQASNIDELIHRGQFEQAQTFLMEMKKTATEAHADAREAIFGLRQRASSASDFLPMLRALLDRFCGTYGIDARLFVQDETANDLSTTVVLQLTRVIQEALTNVRKHAGADTVAVRIDRNDEHLLVTVEDNGRGFDPAEVTKKDCGGVGLQIMRERAESLGGHLEIDSVPGQGTRIVTQIPLMGGR